MLLLVGLGNPEAKYHRNRHNVGFQIIDTIATHHNFGPEKRKFQGCVQEGVIDGHGIRQKTLLLKPATFYNESGNSVREAAQFYKIPIENIVVFHDELDLAPGKVKVKKGGSAAGNNGIKSIMAHVGANFTRVRIGIGHPGDKSKVTSHVLSDFTQSDLNEWVDELKNACARNLPLLTAPESGIDKFMSSLSLVVKAKSQTAPTAERKESKTDSAQADEMNKITQKHAPEPGPFAKLKDLFSKD